MATACSKSATPGSLQVPLAVTPISGMGALFGAAVLEPLEAVLSDSVTLVRLGAGDVQPLGLRALFEACAKSRRVTSVDLSGHDLSQPNLFSCVLKLLQTAWRLRMLSLAHTCIGDQHLCQLQAAAAMHRLDALQALSIAGNGFSPDAVTAFAEHFLMLPNVAVLDLCLIPRLGNTLVSFLHAQLQRGLEWRLSGLLFAYSGLTREGLSELEALLRILSNRLKYMVVSGNTNSCEEWQQVLDAPFEGTLQVLPDVSSIAHLNSAAIAKIAESMLSGQQANGTLAAMFVKMYEDFLRNKQEQGLVFAACTPNAAAHQPLSWTQIATLQQKPTAPDSEQQN